MEQTDSLANLRAECERAIELDAGIETHAKRASRALLRSIAALQAVVDKLAIEWVHDEITAISAEFAADHETRHRSSRRTS